VLVASGCCTLDDDEVVAVVGPYEEEVVERERVIAEVDVTDVGPILFGSGKTYLDPAAQAEADEAVAIMREHPTLEVVLEGHASAAGSSSANLQIGKRRAESVKSYMVSQGIAANRITTITYGEAQPARAGMERLNRRVEVRFVE
jgi:outer membrane protein OmpA-like peptidoglycan-associated protein